ncbi:unnamed protein product, partial [Rotaria sp. Silwood2]
MLNRFSTIILTVFGKNHRIGPVIHFKSKVNIGVDDERQQHSKGVHVIFTIQS